MASAPSTWTWLRCRPERGGHAHTLERRHARHRRVGAGPRCLANEPLCAPPVRLVATGGVAPSCRGASAPRNPDVRTGHAPSTRVDRHRRHRHHRVQLAREHAADEHRSRRARRCVRRCGLRVAPCANARRMVRRDARRAHGHRLVPDVPDEHVRRVRAPSGARHCRDDLRVHAPLRLAFRREGHALGERVDRGPSPRNLRVPRLLRASERRGASGVRRARGRSRRPAHHRRDVPRLRRARGGGDTVQPRSSPARRSWPRTQRSSSRHRRGSAATLATR